MAQKISAPVGRKGKNRPEDVKIIQNLLNPFAAQLGVAKLKVDGTNTPKLEKGISEFQTQMCGFRADGRVDPGKNTIKKLNAGLSKAKAEQKSADQKKLKVKQDGKAKAINAAKAAAEKEAKAKAMDKTALSQLWAGIEAYAEDLYESYFATSEKKGEPAEKAAPKIADMVAKEARKKAAEEVKKAEQDCAVLKPGRLTGKINGVNQKVLNVILEVSSHYGETIHVVSGLRDKKGQASAMFNGWNSHLKNGKVYTYLKSNEKLRLELDEFVQKKNKAGFINHMMKNADWRRVSRHLSGDAADVTTRTNPKIIKALAKVLHYLPESNSEGIKCHHFDNRKLVWPISDKVKEKWKV